MSNHEDELSTEKEQEVSSVHLGFIEPIHSEEQLRRIAHRSANFDDWDGGQVGGCPSFLDPAHVPEAPLCQDCQSNMKFICQLYAPVDEYEERAFHRSLYVFGCSRCQNDESSPPGSGVRVFRCQQPQENPYFPADPSLEDCVNWKNHLPETHSVQLCQVCGMRGKYKCPLQQLYFCGKEHQKEYKKHVFDKIQNGEVPIELPSVFPIAELAVVVEVLPPTNPDENDCKDRATMFPTNNDDDDKNDSDADLEQEDLNRMTGRKQTVKQDNYTHNFMQRIKHQADQALRYARWKALAANDNRDIQDTGDGSDDDSKVLWIRQDHLPPSNIPDCPYCGAPRRFEFQLMPQLLIHLNQNEKNAMSLMDDETYQKYKEAFQQAEDLIREAPPEAIPPALVENKERAAKRMRDYLLQRKMNSKNSSKPNMEWGVVAVYTCVKSCGTLGDVQEHNSNTDETGGGPSSLAYREEFAWRQPSLDFM